MFLELFLVGLAVVASGAFGYYIGWATQHPKEPEQPSPPALPNEKPGQLRVIFYDDAGARWESEAVPITLWQPNPLIERWETVEETISVPGPPIPMVATAWQISSDLGVHEFPIRGYQVAAARDILSLKIIDDYD